MSIMQTACISCEGWGCERCKGGPGEQGFSLDEKELMQLRDRVRELEAERDAARAALVDWNRHRYPLTMAGNDYPPTLKPLMDKAARALGDV